MDQSIGTWSMMWVDVEALPTTQRERFQLIKSFTLSTTTIITTPDNLRWLTESFGWKPIKPTTYPPRSTIQHKRGGEAHAQSQQTRSKLQRSLSNTMSGSNHTRCQIYGVYHPTYHWFEIVSRKKKREKKRLQEILELNVDLASR